MAATKAKCPRCGGKLHTDADRLVCEGCGARGVLKQKPAGDDTGIKKTAPTEAILAPVTSEFSLPDAPPPIRRPQASGPWVVLGIAILFCIAGLASTAYCVAKTLSAPAEVPGSS